MKTSFFSVFLFISFYLFSNDAAARPDPYVWLENDELPQSQEWLANQRAGCEDFFPDDSIRKTVQGLLKKFIDFDLLDVPYKNGENYFFTGRLKGQKQVCLYKLDATKVLHTLVDPIELCNNGTVSLSGYVINGQKNLMTYGLSHAGSDWQEWHIKNLDSDQNYGEILENIKFEHPVWDQTGNGLFYFSFDNNHKKNDSSSIQRLYYHQLGTSSSQDQLLLENTENALFYFSPCLTEDNRYFLFSVKRGFGDNNGILYTDLSKKNFKFVELISLNQGNFDYVGNLENRLFFITDQNAPRGKIISIDPLNPEPKNWLEHISEDLICIENATLIGNKIIVSYLKDATSKVKIFDQQGRLFHEVVLPGLGTIGSIRKVSERDQKYENSEFFYSYTDFTQPPMICRCNVETGINEIFSAPKKFWDSLNYEVKQIFYSSKDGTRIPMFVIHKKGLTLDGSNPTLLYGYGGFKISLTPGFNPRMMSWLELGGVYAIANIRGGGEYGEEWHKAGMLRNKQNVFDDFIAAAEWLCHRQYTNPSKLAINGRSNGGLLVGACLIQRPDLFRAAIAGVGVLDMLRFHLFTVGWSWTSEYGSPDNAEDNENLFAYSPYHQVKQGIAYPATLITTSDHDNRVVPLHSYKFAAALQACQAGPLPILLKVYENTGHGFGRSVQQLLKEDTDLLYFLIKELKVDIPNLSSEE